MWSGVGVAENKCCAVVLCVLCAGSQSVLDIARLDYSGCRRNHEVGGI